MKYLLFAISFIIIGFCSCENEYTPNLTTIKKFKTIESLFNKQNDTVYVINFWATTCPPCLKEMPLFEEASKKHINDKFQVYLVNIDEKGRREKHIVPFLKKLKINNKVFALIDEDMSSWTAKVNPEWYGALPYTVIYKGKNKKYFFGAFKGEDELEKEIQSFLKL